MDEGIRECGRAAQGPLPGSRGERPQLERHSPFKPKHRSSPNKANKYAGRKLQLFFLSQPSCLYVLLSVVLLVKKLFKGFKVGSGYAALGSRLSRQLCIMRHILEGDSNPHAQIQPNIAFSVLLGSSSYVCLKQIESHF